MKIQTLSANILEIQILCCVKIWSNMVHKHPRYRGGGLWIFLTDCTKPRFAQGEEAMVESHNLCKEEYSWSVPCLTISKFRNSQGAQQPGLQYNKREACFPPDWADSILDTIKFFSEVTIIMVAGILISLLGERQIPSTSDRLHVCQLVSPLLINTSMIPAIEKV